MSVLLWLLACSPEPPAAPPPPRFSPPPIQRIDRDPGAPDGLAPDTRTLVFFVADTVRADRTSVCGHPRPTTPTLAGLVEGGAQLRCDGVSPGSWTVPAHASLFSGLNPWEHGAHRYDAVSGDCATVYEEALVGSLAAPTWLSQLQDRGWRTVCLTENKAVSDAFGLTAGCGTWIQVHKWAAERDPERSVQAFAAQALASDDPRPLALFVNVMDAHRRLAEVPEGHAWLPRQPPLGADETWDELRLAPDGPLRTRYDDLYDHGVWRADQKLGQILAVARAERPDGLRLVATSDHGEMLGEGGFVSHGNGVWDPLIRVPVVVEGFAAPLSEGPLSTAVLRDLVLGEPLRDAPSVAVSTPNPFWAGRFPAGWADQVEVVRYDGSGRTLCREGGCVAQVAPVPVNDAGEPVQAPELVRLRDALPRALDCARVTGLDERLELLRELGYIE